VTKLSVDRTEYEALCDLRDHAHERVLARLAIADETAATWRAAVAQQADRLWRQDQELATLRAALRAAETRATRAEACVRDLEPPRLSVVGDQPLFAKRKA
jgi:hypothetical protein